MLARSQAYAARCVGRVRPAALGAHSRAPLSTHDVDFLRDLPKKLTSDRAHIGTTKGRFAFSGKGRQDPRSLHNSLGARNGIFLLDAEEQNAALRRAALAMKEVIAEGGRVLIIGETRGDPKVESKLAELIAETRQVHALTLPWMKGTLSNWREFAHHLGRFRLARSRKMLAAPAPPAQR
jgi:ribosomal protein S2